MAQFPEAAIGTFAGVLIYSFICLFGSLLVIWLTFRHREWTSYVALLGYFTTLATTCSIIQQIHTMMFWEDLMTERFYYARAHSDSPELTLTGISLGLDRVLFYIQYYCYHVEGLIVTFWGMQLVQSLYRLNENPKLRRTLNLLNRGGKVFAILFPVVIIGTLQALLATKNYAVFKQLARQPLMWSVGIGCVTIVAILFRYIQSRVKLQKFNVTYANSQSLGTQNDAAASGPDGSIRPVTLKRNIYDRWLVARFVIAFFILSFFELSIVLFSKSVQSNLDAEHIHDKPDVSAKRAQNDFAFFAPGVTASLLTFLVFGTTKPFLRYMRECIFGPPKQSNGGIIEYSSEPSSGHTHTSKTSLVQGGIELVAPTRAYYTNMRD